MKEKELNLIKKQLIIYFALEKWELECLKLWKYVYN